MKNWRKTKAKIHKRVFCDFLGWHRPTDEIKVYGILITSICRYCGRPIMRDSQGNWFDF